MDSRTHTLLTAPPLPLLAGMAAPNSIAFIVQGAVSLMEVWFISQLGTPALAAIALVFPMLMLTQTMSGGAMGGAIAASVARSLGAGHPDRAERLLWHALALAAGGAATFLVVFALGGRVFLEALGGSGDVLEQASIYCTILFGGGVFIWLTGAVSAMYRGMGNMRFPAAMMIAGACVQVPLSGVLVLGAFGFPQLGVAGAAVSAVVSGLLVSGSMLAHLVFGQNQVRLRVARLQFQQPLFHDLGRVFAPAALSPLLSVATVLCLTAIVGRFGEYALAGYGIGSRIEFLIIPLVFGLGAAMTSLVGMSIGAGDVARAERVGWTGGISAALLAGGVGLVLALTPGAWIPLFTDNPQVFEAARSYIQIVGPCYAFFGLGLSLYFASQGAGAMLWPVVATVARIVLAVGGALLLAFGINMQLDGVFWAAGAGMVAYGALIALSVKLGAWRGTARMVSA